MITEEYIKRAQDLNSDLASDLIRALLGQVSRLQQRIDNIPEGQDYYYLTQEYLY